MAKIPLQLVSDECSGSYSFADTMNGRYSYTSSLFVYYLFHQTFPPAAFVVSSLRGVPGNLVLSQNMQISGWQAGMDALPLFV